MTTVGKDLVLIPNGWPCTLAECPPGLFMFGKCLGFKSEYANDIFVVDSGEAFWVELRIRKPETV